MQAVHDSLAGQTMPHGSPFWTAEQLGLSAASWSFWERGMKPSAKRRRSGALPGLSRRKPGGKSGYYQRGAFPDAEDGGQSDRAAQRGV